MSPFFTWYTWGFLVCPPKSILPKATKSSPPLKNKSLCPAVLPRDPSLSPFPSSPFFEGTRARLEDPEVKRGGREPPDPPCFPFEEVEGRREGGAAEAAEGAGEVESWELEGEREGAEAVGVDDFVGLL